MRGPQPRLSQSGEQQRQSCPALLGAADAAARGDPARCDMALVLSAGGQLGGHPVCLSCGQLQCVSVLQVCQRGWGTAAPRPAGRTRPGLPSGMAPAASRAPGRCWPSPAPLSGRGSTRRCPWRASGESCAPQRCPNLRLLRGPCDHTVNRPWPRVPACMSWCPRVPPAPPVLPGECLVPAVPLPGHPRGRWQRRRAVPGVPAQPGTAGPSVPAAGTTGPSAGRTRRRCCGCARRPATWCATARPARTTSPSP